MVYGNRKFAIVWIVWVMRRIVVWPEINNNNDNCSNSSGNSNSNSSFSNSSRSIIIIGRVEAFVTFSTTIRTRRIHSSSADINPHHPYDHKKWGSFIISADDDDNDNDDDDNKSNDDKRSNKGSFVSSSSSLSLSSSSV